MAMTRELGVSKYRVDIIESERGWGSKVIDMLYFDTEEEAKTHIKSVNAKNNLDYVPDYYIYATYVGRVQ